MSDRRLSISDAATLAVAFAALSLVVLTFHDRYRQARSAGTVEGAARLAAARVTPADLAAWAQTAHRIGPNGAPVKIVMFANFLCGFCGELATSLDQLQAKYPEQISIAYKHLVPSKGNPMINGYDFALASECAAEQGRFAQFYEHVYAAKVRTGALSELGGFARDAGVRNSQQFETCMLEKRYADKVDADAALATQWGFSATPTWFVNGKLVVGAPSQEELERRIVQELRPKGGED